jgi:hypothetical protein
MIRLRFWDVVEIVGGIPGWLVCVAIWAPMRRGVS